MPESESVSRYEVRCPRCDVSFPVETKRCIHCGGRTGPSAAGSSRAGEAGGMIFASAPRMGPSAGTESPGVGRDTGSRSNGISSGLPGARLFGVAGEVAGEEQDDEEQVTARPSMLRVVSTLIWVGLALALSLSRSCSG